MMGRAVRAAVFVRELGGPLQQAGVQVEHVAGVGLAARRPAEQQGELPVGNGLLGQVVVDDDGVLAVVAEVLAHGAAGERRDVLQRGGLGRRGCHHDGVVHGVVLLEPGHHLGHGGALLPDRDVDADHVGVALVDDRVDRHRGLAGLAVADDQLTLTPADRNHGVDGLQAGLEGLVHRLAQHDARGLHVDDPGLGGLDVAQAVHGVAQGVHHPAQQALAHGHRHDAARALDDVALLDVDVLAEDGGTHVVLFQVQGHAHDAAGELHELSGHALLQAVEPGDAVSHGQDDPGLGHVHVGLEVLDLGLDDLADLFGADLHGSLTPSSSCRAAAGVGCASWHRKRGCRPAP